ncbi:hypothetical protein MPSEU_000679600 [Mayamaea pseudoterrestris]|nr:hypothetical protein MPSEU_000679600 [Mayamaea pseudoterrestris]
MAKQKTCLDPLFIVLLLVVWKCIQSFPLSEPRSPRFTDDKSTVNRRLFSHDSILTMSNHQNEWLPLNPESFVSAKCLIEQTLCTPSDSRPQLAKDFDYANAILDAWQDEIKNDNDNADDNVEYKPVVYQNSEKVLLHGYLVRRRRLDNQKMYSDLELAAANKQAPSPAVIFFHTGAGPHDLFLLWKASSLISSQQLRSLDCQVLVADILGDDRGWAWSTDRERYTTTRNLVLQEQPDANGESHRPLLQQRIQASLNFIATDESIDSTRLAALGWCLGGHSILELARMQCYNMRAMATFHGVFDGASAVAHTQTESTSVDTAQGQPAEILLCHGVNDPFVSDQQLHAAMATFQRLRYRLSLLQLSAKHGFTNPAQDFNDNPAFAYDQEAANKAWRQALALLQRSLGIRYL